jgi:uncharacterized protein
VSLRDVIRRGGKVTPPPWLADNLCYETMMGSVAYGVNNDTSDVDVYGACFPPKDLVFPHLAGEIAGFGRQIKRFNTWQEHHVQTPDEKTRTWDFQIYGVVTYCQLAMECNPNVLDSLFTPRRCVLSSTAAGEYLREHRDDFLHKGAWHKFKGYAYAQLHKIRTKRPDPGSKRAALVEEHGYDVKFAYHVVRLLLEVEQVMAEATIDLERHREQLKEIRRGEWSVERVDRWAQDKERDLEALYASSKLRHSPDEPLVRRHLLHVLEHHYGDLSTAVAATGEPERALRDIAALAARWAR